MSRCVELALVVAVACALAQAQPDSLPAPALGAAVPAIERYLADRRLTELLATHLLRELRSSSPDRRMGVAERLGKVYVQLLDRAPTPAERERWRQRSLELLQAVPESDSFDLRINLTRVTYRQAEDIAEAHRLRLATPEQVQEALGILRSSAATFRDIGMKVHRRVEAFERREALGRAEEEEAVTAVLADNRRLRSLAMYYAGWSHYYLAMLEGKVQPIDDALTEFGWILNAGEGRPASVERLPGSMIRYPHVARAALACAMCESLRGNDDTALRWLEAVETGEGVEADILTQVTSLRLDVLCRARRWADVELLVRRARAGTAPKPLPVGEARLLAVLTLDALEAQTVLPRAVESVRKLADTAITDLIALGEVRQVLDLAARYGTATLSAEGFIPNYVRGLQAYDRARKLHAESGESPDEPSTQDAVRNAYAQAADSLAVALADAEAGRFTGEAANAGLVTGLAHYYGGDLVRAADRFEQVFRAGGKGTQPEEALWLATVALDRAVSGGKPSLTERRDATAALYLKTYPRSDRAAQLLIRLASSGLMSEAQAVETLLAVEPQSAVYEAARRQAASLLYMIYRRAPRGADKDHAALRFAEVAEQAMAFDRGRLEDPDEQVSREAVKNLVTRARQVLDAVLSMPAPDLDRAERVLSVLDGAAAYTAVDLGAVRDELTFRRLQIAMARRDDATVTARLDELYAMGGRFADAAARLLYRRALDAWTPGAGDGASPREVVRHGLIVIGQFGTDARSVREPSVYTLYHTVAAAAAELWESGGDRSMLDVALRLDRTLQEAGAATAPVLQRLARLSEAAGDQQAALDAWRTLLTGLTPGAAEWHEARFHSLRLLAATDPARAREAIDQHKLLHPDLGPEPWGSKLKALDEALVVPPQPGDGGAG